MKSKLSLRDIASWQLDPENSEVDLPIVQRGFVWKPKQIEDLWDSILRGYPIGSFLMQQSGDKFDLLDGQQRATSIMLGFVNPYSSNNSSNVWSDRTNRLHPNIWIDIDDKSAMPLSNKYSVRVTTMPHPWGYQAVKNNTVLSVPDRRNALSLFRKNEDNKNKIYTKFSSHTVFPYDSSMPVPLSILIASKNVEEVMENLKVLPSHIQTKQNSDQFMNLEAYINLLNTTFKANLENIFNLVQLRISDKGTKVNYDIVQNEIINESINNSDSQQDPTLFVRVNSSGTTLGGDDLIYSIYKSLYPSSKRLIESIGSSFAPEKLIISLASRLSYTSVNDFKFPDRMTVQRFQQLIATDDFKNKLEKYIGNDKNSIFKNLFFEAIELLKYSNSFGEPIPNFLIKQLILKNSDLFLFLLTWLNNNSEISLSSDYKFKIVGKILSLDWFGFDNYRELWQNIDNPNFFDEPLTNLISLSITKGMKAIVPPKLLKDYFSETFDQALELEGGWKHKFLPTKSIMDYYKKTYPEVDESKIEDEFHNFIMWIRETQNKSLISFSQRGYLNRNFSEYNSMESLEDSSVPWDWDHIYPASWVSNKRVKYFSIRYWTWSIGNYRALSLEQNRAESNNLSPAERLSDKDIRTASFVFDNDYKYWSQIVKRTDDQEISARNHLNAVLTRMINIYEKYWIDLNMDSFFYFINEN